MEMHALVDQPLPGSVSVPALPPPPAVEAVELEAALAAARDEALSAFAAVAARLAADQEPGFAALADTLARLVSLEWRALAPRARDSSLVRLAAWCAAMPGTIDAIADCANAPRGDALARALLRRRCWQYADAFRESLAWRRAHFARVPARLAAN